MSGRRTHALRAAGGLVARERLERHGAGTLANEEVLAILVGASGAHTAVSSGTIHASPRPSPGGLPDGRDTPRGRHRVLSRPHLGDPTPSVDDVALTERRQQAGTLMGIKVLDRVIPADTRCCSFKAMGRL